MSNAKQNHTILVADDDVAFLQALTIRLGSEGYDVVAARDAVQAVGVARRCTPDLLILDVNMPAGDGFTVQQRIQSIDGMRDVPAINLTGDRSTRASAAARAMQARALLYKPLDTGRLLVTVAEILGASESFTKQALDELQHAADQWAATRR
jgi:DNA-binding response OmpR family regulator